MGLGAFRIEGADLTDNAIALVDARQVNTAKRGRLYYVVVYNTTAVDAWFQFHYVASTPAGGTVPAAQIKVPADSFGYLDFGAGGRPITNGIFLGGSTSKVGYTATVTAGWIIDTGYRNF